MLDYEEQYRREQKALENFTKVHATEIVEIEDNIEYFPGYDSSEDDPYDYYPDLYLGEKRSELHGSLRDMVIKRVDAPLDAVVEIIESHENGGYCGTCAFEYIVFTILVDGMEVYRESFGDENPFGMLQEWLTEGDDE